MTSTDRARLPLDAERVGHALARYTIALLRYAIRLLRRLPLIVAAAAIAHAIAPETSFAAWCVAITATQILLDATVPSR